MSSAGHGKSLRGNTMEQRWIETFQMWSKTEEYQGRIKEAQNVIKTALSRYNNPYLSYSGGKDSTVMLHLVLQQKADIPVWHWDYGEQLMPREIEKEVVINANEIGAKKIIVCKRKGENARDDYVSGYRQFFRTLKKLKEKYRWDLGFVGVRQEESYRRKRLYKSFFRDNICYPLLKLSWKDIWACIVSNKLPYASVYDTYSELVGWDKSRLVTFFDNEFESVVHLDSVLMPEFRNVRNRE